jgi:hypothetical protein
MSFEPPTTSDRKRKSTEAPEAVVSSSTVGESRPRDTRRRRVSTDAASNVTSTYASMATGTPEHNHAMPIRSVESIEKLIQDLSSPDRAVVKASIHTLGRDVFDAAKGSQILGKIVAVGGCFALVQLAKISLEKARMEFQNCDQVTRVQGSIMPLLSCSLRIISTLTFMHPVSKDIISSIEGVKLVVTVLKTFPNCEELQSAACDALCNLTTTFVGMEKASEVDAIKVLLTTVKSYPVNNSIFRCGCNALTNMCESNFEQTKLLIDLGGITTWPDDPDARVAANALLQVMARGVHYLINMY